MEIITFLQKLTNSLHTLSDSTSKIERDLCCEQTIKDIKACLKEEKNFSARCKVITQCLMFFGAVRPLCEVNNITIDTLGHTIFLECARLVLGIEFQQAEDDDKKSLGDTVTETFINLQNFMINQVFLVLQWLISNGWSHPTLSALMTVGDLDEETALTYLQSGEFPEILKLRIEILIEQQCEDLALNLCSWCVRSPVFEEDVFIRKTHLVLSCKHGQEDFHANCLKVPCCMLVTILNDLNQNPETSDTALLICQTAVLQHWLHPEQVKDCCTQKLLHCLLHQLRSQEKDGSDKQTFLNGVNKISQLSVNQKQKRLLLESIVNLFGEDYLQFCVELGLDMLKKDRFLLDAAKIKRDESEADEATLDIITTCRVMTSLFQAHQQMCLACMLTVFYFAPDQDLFIKIKNQLRFSVKASPEKPVPPQNLDAEVYKEILCVVDMLRPTAFHPKNGWTELKQVLVVHMLESGFKFDLKSGSFRKIIPKRSDQLPNVKTSPASVTSSLMTSHEKTQTLSDSPEEPLSRETLCSKVNTVPNINISQDIKRKEIDSEDQRCMNCQGVESDNQTRCARCSESQNVEEVISMEIEQHKDSRICKDAADKVHYLDTGQISRLKSDGEESKLCDQAVHSDISPLTSKHINGNTCNMLTVPENRLQSELRHNVSLVTDDLGNAHDIQTETPSSQTESNVTIASATHPLISFPNSVRDSSAQMNLSNERTEGLPSLEPTHPSLRDSSLVKETSLETQASDLNYTNILGITYPRKATLETTEELNSSTESVLCAFKVNNSEQLPVLSLDTLNNVLSESGSQGCTVESEKSSTVQNGLTSPTDINLSKDIHQREAHATNVCTSPQNQPSPETTISSPLLDTLSSLPTTQLHQFSSRVDGLIRDLLVKHGKCTTDDVKYSPRAKLLQKLQELRAKQGQSPEMTKVYKCLVLEDALKTQASDKKKIPAKPVSCVNSIVPSSMPTMNKPKSPDVNDNTKKVLDNMSENEGPRNTTSCETSEKSNVNKPQAPTHEVQYDASKLVCRFCKKEYESVILRRRHEDFFCADRTDNGVEFGSPEFMNNTLSSNASTPALTPKSTPGIKLLTPVCTPKNTPVQKVITPLHTPSPKPALSPGKPPLKRNRILLRDDGTYSYGNSPAKKVIKMGNRQITIYNGPSNVVPMNLPVKRQAANFDLKIERLDTSTRCNFCKTYFLSVSGKKLHQETCEQRLKFLEKSKQAELERVQSYHKQKEESVREMYYASSRYRVARRKCRFCRQRYDNLVKLRRHEKWCALQIPEGYSEPNNGSLSVCKYCQRMYDTRRNLDCHIVQCHPETYEEQPSESESSEDDGVTVFDNRAELLSAGDTGDSSQDSLLDVCVEEEEVVQENCAEGDSDVDVENETDTNGPPILDQAQHTSSAPACENTNEQVWSYAELPSWPCTRCPLRAHSFTSLMVHIMHVHGTDESPYLFRCPYCTGTARNEASHPEHLIRHILMTHRIPRKKFNLDTVQVRRCPEGDNGRSATLSNLNDDDEEEDEGDGDVNQQVGDYKNADRMSDNRDTYDLSNDREADENEEIDVESMSPIKFPQNTQKESAEKTKKLTSPPGRLIDMVFGRKAKTKSSDVPQVERNKVQNIPLPSRSISINLNTTKSKESIMSSSVNKPIVIDMRSHQLRNIIAQNNGKLPKPASSVNKQVILAPADQLPTRGRPVGNNSCLNSNASGTASQRLVKLIKENAALVGSTPHLLASRLTSQGAGDASSLTNQGATLPSRLTNQGAEDVSSLTNQGVSLSSRLTNHNTSTKPHSAIRSALEQQFCMSNKTNVKSPLPQNEQDIEVVDLTSDDESIPYSEKRPTNSKYNIIKRQQNAYSGKTPTNNKIRTLKRGQNACSQRMNMNTVSKQLAAKRNTNTAVMPRNSLHNLLKTNIGSAQSAGALSMQGSVRRTQGSAQAIPVVMALPVVQQVQMRKPGIHQATAVPTISTCILAPNTTPQSSTPVARTMLSTPLVSSIQYTSKAPHLQLQSPNTCGVSIIRSKGSHAQYVTKPSNVIGTKRGVSILNLNRGTPQSNIGFNNGIPETILSTSNSSVAQNPTKIMTLGHKSSMTTLQNRSQSAMVQNNDQTSIAPNNVYRTALMTQQNPNKPRVIIYNNQNAHQGNTSESNMETILFSPSAASNLTQQVRSILSSSTMSSNPTHAERVFTVVTSPCKQSRPKRDLNMAGVVQEEVVGQMKGEQSLNQSNNRSINCKVITVPTAAQILPQLGSPTNASYVIDDTGHIVTNGAAPHVSNITQLNGNTQMSNVDLNGVTVAKKMRLDFSSPSQIVNRLPVNASSSQPGHRMTSETVLNLAHATQVYQIRSSQPNMTSSQPNMTSSQLSMTSPQPNLTSSQLKFNISAPIICASAPSDSIDLSAAQIYSINAMPGQSGPKPGVGQH